MDDRAQERSREIRIGLVMYGGVSLAIYMNGVTNEIFRAVRGRGVYKLAKALTDTDIAVDVVSGASAGGINGMFLAFALCNDKEFSACADLWRKEGDILRLLRKTDAPAEAQVSLLDSEGFFEPRLGSAFQSMWDSRIEPDEAADAKSEARSNVDELDLFVAATDFGGRVSRTVDAAGHVVDVKDHRTTFWLKHRADRKEQLNPEADATGRGLDRGRPEVVARDRRGTGFAAFAKLARITSCFPAAFAPVEVNVPAGEADGPETTEQAVGRRLGVWGALDPGRYHFLDGGILDNKPFTSTLRTIFYRMANRPVKRHLIYVEPDPERFQRGDVAAPTFITSALDSLTRLPSYESIAGDLRQIADHNDTIERFTRAWRAVRARVMTPSPAEARRQDAAAATAARAAPQITTAAVAAVAADLGSDDQGEALYARARLQALGEMVIAAVLNLEVGASVPGGAGGDAEGMTRERMAGLRTSFDDRLREVSGDGARDLFASFDVEFRVRRLLHLTYVIDEDEREGTLGLEPEVRKELLGAVGRRVELLEIARAHMLRALEHASRIWFAPKQTPGDLWDRILARLTCLLDARALDDELGGEILNGEPARGAPERLRAVLATRADAPPDGDSAAAAGAGPLLLGMADRGDLAILDRLAVGPGAARLRAEYDRYKDVDRILFPMQFLSGVYERDMIHTVRISPHDARRGLSQADDVAAKVCGDTLAHFGAFLKRSWRSNDLLYGRLDGACQLLETILDEDLLARALGSPAQRVAAVERLGGKREAAGDREARLAAVRAYLDGARIFPRAGAPAVAAAAEALADLLDPAAPAGAPSPELRERVLDALVLATHLDIVDRDYHTLIDDAIEERLAWRQGALEGDRVDAQAGAPGTPLPRFDPPTRAFDVTLDDAVVAAAARAFASGTNGGGASASERAAALRASPVGGESVGRDIPRLVLLEIVAHALLVLRNCVLNSLGPDRAADVRESRVYQLFVDWPLRTFYAVARRMRAAPRWVGVYAGVAGGYFALVLAAHLLWGNFPASQEGYRRWIAEGLFRVLPATAAVVAGLAIWASGRRDGILRRVVRLVVATAARLVPLGVLGGLAYVVSERATPALCGTLGLDAGGACGPAARSSALVAAALIGAGLGGWLARPKRGVRARVAETLTKGRFTPEELTILEQRVMAPIRVDLSKATVLAPKKRQAQLLRMAETTDRMGRLEQEMRVLRP